nr:MAG TPA_asm: Protein of unknown function (DUF1507) [Caudoviricetes sp.]
MIGFSCEIDSLYIHFKRKYIISKIVVVFNFVT